MLLACVPLAFVAAGGLLGLSGVLEQRILSPRSMIVTAARSRRSAPEFVESFVAHEVERLLRDAQRR